MPTAAPTHSDSIAQQSYPSLLPFQGFNFPEAGYGEDEELTKLLRSEPTIQAAARYTDGRLHICRGQCTALHWQAAVKLSICAPLGGWIRRHKRYLAMRQM